MHELIQGDHLLILHNITPKVKEAKAAVKTVFLEVGLRKINISTSQLKMKDGRPETKAAKVGPRDPPEHKSK